MEQKQSGLKLQKKVRTLDLNLKLHLNLHKQPYLHLNSWRLAWIIMCRFNFDSTKKPFPQVSQWNRFWSSEVCILAMWSLSLLTLRPQKGHGDFSLWLSLIWSLRTVGFLYSLPHDSHVTGSISWLYFLCDHRAAAEACDDPHSLQTQDVFFIGLSLFIIAQAAIWLISSTEEIVSWHLKHFTYSAFGPWSLNTCVNNCVSFLKSKSHISQ